MDGVIEGRIVHYVPTGVSGDGFRQPGDRHIPGMVCRVIDAGQGIVNIRLSCDGRSDNPGGRAEHVVGVRYSESMEPGTWHWIEGAEKRRSEVAGHKPR